MCLIYSALEVPVNQMLSRIAGIIVLMAGLAVAWFIYEFNKFTHEPLNLPQQGMVYLLEPGSSFSKMAQELKRRGVLKNALYLKLLARWRGGAEKIRAGEYHLPAGITPAEFLELFISGKVIVYSLTLVEGWTFNQMFDVIRSHTALK